MCEGSAGRSADLHVLYGCEPPAAASWWAVMASSNRCTSPRAMPRVAQRLAFAVPAAGLPVDTQLGE
jgi:hypothetical protein